MSDVEPKVHHPVFARTFDRMSRRVEAMGGAEHRRDLLEGLTGRVIEVGAGNGLNFSYYPHTVDEVLAVEPEAYLRERAREAAGASPVPTTVIEGTAERLPVDDESFDAAVVSLVLCSVADPDRSLAEIRRVLKPGGELRFYEHVVATSPRFSAFQRRLDVVWPRLGGGCHASRDTAQSITDAGFAIEQCRRFSFAPLLLAKPVAPHILGIARRPA